MKQFTCNEEEMLAILSKTLNLHERNRGEE